jgi:dTDP-4-dehydrorhamnose reductase
MKILVLGAGGMAGHVTSLYLREQGNEVDTLSARNKLDDKTYLVDVMDLESLKKILSAKKYDAIINCIGLLVKQSEERKDLSTFINSFLPHFLEQYCKESTTRLIHLSTDCVFSGKNPPYKEDSPYDGELFYDRTKALGEVINNKDLTFRMSIIGPDMQAQGIGLFNWFFKQTGEINGYTTAIWNGITTIELAKGIQAALEQNLTGLYHLVPEKNISKYDLLNTFKVIFKRNDITINPTENVALDKTLVNTRHDFSFEVSNYETMVREMKKWIESHTDHYGHYTQGGVSEDQA